MIKDKGLANDVIPLPKVPSRALYTVIKYCTKHANAATKPADSDPSAAAGSSSANAAASSEDLEKWDRELVDSLGQDALYDLMLAANYLDIQGLLDAICQKVADMIKGKTTAQIRATFNIVNDFTEAEEEEIRREYAWAFDN
ncbi:SKP1-like protein 1 [Phragmites australis]|uniref:SKP1-like protein 1 n=1 Tax=Phragmites australis TaxID=29695 RepID=UPI002D79BCE1|nr:SKP1-like protein 1 [Phragmites australis]